MDELDGVEIIAFADAGAFEGWLAGHFTRHEGVWIRMAKKNSGIPSVTSDELVDIGLCYGWISGQRRSSTSGTTCRSTCRAGPGACGRG